MSDRSEGSAQTPAVAAATQALAIRELGDEIEGIKKQFKALWVAVGVVGVLTLIVTALTLLPRFGVRTGGAGLSGRPGMMNGQQFDRSGGGPGGPQQTAP